MTSMRRRAAAKQALELVARFGIVSPDQIELEDIAFHFGADVVVGGLSGAVARMSRVGERTVIRVADTSDLGLKRFSMAHEIGHLLMHDGCMKTCDQADLENWRAKGEQEAEANAFAAELLMPSTLALRSCEVSPVSIKLIRSIAKDFRASITATAIRFVELTSEPCAVAHSGDGVIDWVIPNKHFGSWLLGKNDKLDSRTIASRLTRSGEIEQESHVPADAWIRSDNVVMKGGEWLHESSIRGHEGHVLSILWRDSMPDDDDIDD